MQSCSASINIGLALISLILIVGCQKPVEFGPQTDIVDVPIPFEPEQDRILIGNEGNFMLGNASLSLLVKPDSVSEFKLENNAYQSKNTKPIGDVVQSMYQFGDRVFIVINNSGLIRVLDSENLKELAVIDQLPSPRYMHFLDSNTALVSNLYDDVISVIDLVELRVKSTIKVDGWIEQLEAIDGRLYLANRTQKRIDVLDISSLSVVDSIKLDTDPAVLLLDSMSKQLVIAGPNKTDIKSSTIQLYSTQTDLVSTVQNLSNLSITKGTLDGKGQLYLVGSHLWELSLIGNQLDKIRDGAAFQNLYGVGAYDGQILLAEAKDYQSQGQVYLLDQSGVEVQRFQVGVIPGSFLVLR